MRRTVAVLAAAALLLPAAAAADPLDLDLARLGAPSAGVWSYLDAKLGLGVAGQEAQLAADARQRFALLSTEMGLALSSFILSPAATTGYSGFEFDVEVATAPVHAPVVGTGPYAADYWPTRGVTPRQLLLPAFHVRKSLPFSIELGGRAIYVNQSQMVAVQGEAKWAIIEGTSIPDVAVRGALTHLYGQRDWDLTTADLDLMLGKKFGVGGVMSLTPYAAIRVTWLGASTDVIDFGATTVTGADIRSPDELTASQAAFPKLQMHDHRFLRYTVGVRLVTYALSIAAEATYFDGYSFRGAPPAALGDQGYPGFTIHPSLSGAAKLGFEF